MYQIRKGIFETNSSSSHSISLSWSDNFSDLLRGNLGKIYAEGGQFGWGVETFIDCETKLAYLITHFFSQCQSQKDVDDIIENNKNYKMLVDVIFNYTKCDLIVEFPEKYDYYPFGYIDHESQGIASDAFESDLVLANYLFNPQSELIISNDNC